MNREKAEAYLERKGKDVSEKNIEKVMKQGKIYGDPIAMCQ